MNKIQIKKYLKDEQEKAIKKLRGIKEIEEQKEREKRAMSALADLPELDIEIECLFEKVKKIKENFVDDEVFNFTQSAASNLYYYLSCVVNRGLQKDIADHLIYRYSLRSKAQNKYISNKEKINEEYAKINGNIESMTGQQATKYLIELGFDLPAIEEKKKEIKNEVLAPINIKFLKDMRALK